MPAIQARPNQVCPCCGGENQPDAVFCANPQCHKALGEFRYALEEVDARSKWHLALMNRFGDFIGKPAFVGIHVVWILAWIGLNSGLLMAIRQFDSYPFGLLGLILAIEAIMITSIVIISSRTQAALADKRAELDYEVNVQTYREIRDMMEMLDSISERLESIEKRLPRA
jgi:uncharacterized membrane protein